MQFRARYADPFILPLVVALNIGLTMIYRLDPQIAAPVGDGQLMWTGVSMVLCAIIVFVLRGYRLLRKVTLHLLDAVDDSAHHAAGSGSGYGAQWCSYLDSYR